MDWINRVEKEPYIEFNKSYTDIINVTSSELERIWMDDIHRMLTSNLPEGPESYHDHYNRDQIIKRLHYFWQDREALRLLATSTPTTLGGDYKVTGGLLGYWTDNNSMMICEFIDPELPVEERVIVDKEFENLLDRKLDPGHSRTYPFGDATAQDGSTTKSIYVTGITKSALNPELSYPEPSADSRHSHGTVRTEYEKKATPREAQEVAQEVSESSIISRHKDPRISSVVRYCLESYPDYNPTLKIEKLLDNEMIQNKILFNKAERMARTTAKYAIGGETDSAVYEFDSHSFDRLFDPNLPTLVIDLCSGFRASELTGQVSQILRSAEEPSINIVFTRCDTQSASLVASDSQGAIRVTHGMVVDEHGNVFAGRLPVDVYSNALETTNPFLLAQCQRLGIQTLNSVEAKNEFNEKHTISEIAAAAGVKSPRRFKSSLEDVGRHTRVIVKSSLENGGGKGVRGYMVGETELHSYILFLQAYGYEPLVEEFIESMPISPNEMNDNDTSVKTEADWTVRYTIAEGRVIGTYIKVNSGGISNIAQGGRVYTLDDIHHMSDRAQDIIDVIERDGEKLARVVPSGISGVDTIVGKDLCSYLIEVNVGQLGGMDNLTTLAPHNNKADPHRRLIRAWIESLKMQPIEINSGDINHEENMKRDLIAIFKGLYDADLVELFADIPIGYLKHYEPALWKWYPNMASGAEKIAYKEANRMEYFTSWLWTEVRLYNHIDKDEDKGHLHSIVQDALKLTPAAFIRLLPKIVYNHPKPWLFLDILEDLTQIDPRLHKVYQYAGDVSKKRMWNY